MIIDCFIADTKIKCFRVLNLVIALFCENHVIFTCGSVTLVIVWLGVGTADATLLWLGVGTLNTFNTVRVRV